MTVQNALDYLAVIFDKYGSPSLLESEQLDFLNNAVNEYLNRLIPDNQGGVVNFEEDKNVEANIQPLIYPVPVTTNSTGLATEAVVNAALTTAVGSSSEYFRVAAARVTADDSTIKYVRQANIGPFQDNYFKRPTTSERKFTLLATGLQFYPKATTSATVTVLKKPKIMLDTSAQCEWPDYQMFNIISIAAQLAGVSVRDTELIQDLRNTSVQDNK